MFFYIKAKTVVNETKMELFAKTMKVQAGTSNSKEVVDRQGEHYEFAVAQPLSTFLQELPMLAEKDCYSLSLAREPRKGTKSESPAKYVAS